MQVWMTLILAVQLLTAITMIGLVLIQHGKGADMGASFGSGASGSLFGASGSANFLSRSTAACATVFFICTLTLTYLGTHGTPVSARSGSGKSVLDAPAIAASGAASAPSTGAIPTAPTAPASVAAPAASQAAAPASAAPAAPAASK